jgi:hypothetical protein
VSSFLLFDDGDELEDRAAALLHQGAGDGGGGEVVLALDGLGDRPIGGEVAQLGGEDLDQELAQAVVGLAQAVEDELVGDVVAALDEHVPELEGERSAARAGRRGGRPSRRPARAGGGPARGCGGDAARRAMSGAIAARISMAERATLRSMVPSLRKRRRVRRSRLPDWRKLRTRAAPPCWIATRPAWDRRLRASRTAPRLTRSMSQRLRSEGSGAPGTIRPCTISRESCSKTASERDWRATGFSCTH